MSLRDWVAQLTRRDRESQLIPWDRVAQLTRRDRVAQLILWTGWPS